eukprot:m.69414 g.69414  ORF g.69414 m.69414 type:complete len:592 (-) comp11624_c0_seq1:72-1847(-)
MPFFHTAPLSDIENAIDAAVSPNTPEGDFVAYFSICDLVNDTRDGHKLAIKALKAKMTLKSPPVTVLKTLNVTDTLVKNCGKKMHMAVTSKEYIGAMLKIYKHKNTSSAVKEKILSLIQSWSQAFKSDPNLRYVCEVYEDMKYKGVEFPAQNFDEMAPIHTPDASVLPETEEMNLPSDSAEHHELEMNVNGRRTRIAANQQQQQQQALTANDEQLARMMAAELNREQQSHPRGRRNRRQQQQPQQPQQQQQFQVQEEALERVRVSDQQAEKIGGELLVVRNNCSLLDGMLGALDPDEPLTSNDLITELRNTCVEMQTRLFALIERVSNEDLMCELLSANDELTFVLTRYKEMLETRQNRLAEQQQQQQQPQQQPQQQQQPLSTSDPFGVPTMGEEGRVLTLEGATTSSSTTEQHNNNTSNDDDTAFASLQHTTTPQREINFGTNTNTNTNAVIANSFDPFSSDEQQTSITPDAIEYDEDNSNSNINSNTNKQSVVDEFDPFSQHSSSTMEDSFRNTNYAVPEAEGDMKTFSSMFSGDQFGEETEEPADMLTSDFFVETQKEKQRRNKQPARAVSNKQKEMMESTDSDLFGL